MAFILCGDDTGLTKRVQLKDNSSVHRLGFQGENRRVHTMAWAGVGSPSGDSWQSLESEVVVGYKSGKVELYNTATKELLANFHALHLTPDLRTALDARGTPAIDPSKRAPKTVNAPSSLAGLAVLQGGGGAGVESGSSSSSYERRLLTCSNTGILHIRPFSTLSLEEPEVDQPPPPVIIQEPVAGSKKKKKGKKAAAPEPMPAPTPAPTTPAVSPASVTPPTVSFSSTGQASWLVGTDLSVLKVEPLQRTLFACGGKEHMLRLWDLNTATQTFKEKNVAHDMLNLRQQVWITDLAFVPGTSGTQLVTGTAFHQVRSYDTRAQKKPLFNVEVSEHAITCVDVSHDGRFIVVGDGAGRLQQLDRRMNARMVHVYHGIGGSVRGIQSHASLPMLAACGLDRFLRVYDVNTRKQLHKVYLKQKLNAVLFSSQLPQQVKEEEGATPADAEDDDELWAELNRRAVSRGASASTESGTGDGKYVKKRKSADGEDDEEEESHKKTKVKQEEDMEEDSASPVASGPSAAALSKKIAAFAKISTTASKAAADEEEEDDEEGEDEEMEDEDDAEQGEDDEEEEVAVKQEPESDDDEEEEDDEPEEVSPPKRARGKTAAATASASKKAKTRR